MTGKVARHAAEIVVMLEAGKTQHSIEQHFGFGQGAVSRLRRRGGLPQVRTAGAQTVRVLRDHHPNLKVGVLSDIFHNMDREVAQWLAAQVPEGSSVVDVLRSLVVDAHAEELP